MGHAVYLRRGPAHQGSHQAQRHPPPPLAGALFQVRHQALLPQRRPDPKGARVLHCTLREKPSEGLSNPKQGSLLYTSHAEQNGK